MTSAKILYLAQYRLPHAIMCLQPEFTKHLIGVDRTCVATPMPQQELWPIFEKYGIDTSNFDYAPDSEIYRLYPEVNNWVLPGDYRGWWLRQQAIKLAFLDYLNYDLMVMHDSDCIIIRDYQPIVDGKLNFMVLENQRHSWGYYETIRNAFGFDRLTPHCFISEYVPVLKEDITAMKLFLEQTHNCNWLDALIENCPGEATVPPWGNGESILWLSEYELIGNWTMSRREINMQPQRRYMYDDMNKIGGFDPDYHTAICDAVPDLSRSVQFDWEKKEVVDFDRWMDLIRQKLSTATGTIKDSIDEELCPGQPNKEWLSRSAEDDVYLSNKYGNNYMAYQRKLKSQNS